MVLDQKAHEISLVLIKISVYVRRKELRERFERLSFDLLEHTAARDLELVAASATALESLVKFGRTIYEIEPVNADMLLESLEQFNAAIRQIREGMLPDIDRSPEIQSILSKSQSLFQNKNLSELVKKKNSIKTLPDYIKKENIVGKIGKETDNPAIESGNMLENPAIRQSAIFQKIKDFSDKSVQLKDIMSLFPSVSERTLRYDLQRLSIEGKIERIGQGGPATYYKARVV